MVSCWHINGVLWSNFKAHIMVHEDSEIMLSSVQTPFNI